MKGVDELVFETHRQTVTGNVVMNERTDKFRIGDTWIALPVAGVFEVGDDGRITLWRDYFDMKMYTDQMAAPRRARERPVGRGSACRSWRTAS